MASGHPIYLSFDPTINGPEPQYNPNGRSITENMIDYIPRELPKQPQAYYDNRRSPAEFYVANIQAKGYTLAELYPYPIADEALRFAPAEPIRKDTFDMLTQRANSPNVAGQSPTKGVWTGLPDLSYGG